MEHMLTKTRLVEILKGQGIVEGDVLFVHSALSKLKWVCGGPQAVIEALQETVGPSGLIAMATQSGDNSEPSEWGAPPVPSEWWPIIREEMPAYDKRKTVTRGVGLVTETFRTYPDVHRSDHPMWSVAAWGEGAEEIVSGHTLENGLGPGSPIGKLIERGAKILHLGSPLDSTTMWHYAEYGIDGPKKQFGCAIIENGERKWVTFEHEDIDSSMFGAIGESIVRNDEVTTFSIGAATCYIIPSSTWETVQQSLQILRIWLGQSEGE